jgi:hypothetical protein
LKGNTAAADIDGVPDPGHRDSFVLQHLEAKFALDREAALTAPVIVIFVLRASLVIMHDDAPPEPSASFRMSIPETGS